MTVPNHTKILKDDYIEGSYSLVKYVASDPAFVYLEKIIYTPWLAKLPDDTGCGLLIHEVLITDDESGEIIS